MCIVLLRYALCPFVSGIRWMLVPGCGEGMPGLGRVAWQDGAALVLRIATLLVAGVAHDWHLLGTCNEYLLTTVPCVVSLAGLGSTGYSTQ